LHTSLKLQTALSYAAKLRLRVDGNGQERRDQVEKVIQKLELDKNRETRIDKLSGGQRKRASVALELLTEPSLLILDEPTSGLDPAMDRQVMKTLRELADDERGVLVVTHSVAHLDVCDEVLVLAPGGMPAYLGSPEGIKGYFGTTDWADIFAVIKNDPEAAYQKYLSQGPEVITPPAEMRAGDNSGVVRSAPWFEQFATLCTRQVSLIFADKGYLAFLAFLPVLVGLLVLVVPGTHGFAAAENALPLEPSQLLAMLIIGSSFMGASISIRDLVGERQVFLRERAVGLPVTAYLASKLLIFSIFAWAMAAMLTFVTLLAKPAPIVSIFLPWPAVELFLALGLTSMAAMVLGLFLSSLVSSSDQVMPLLIVVLMAQLVLNGGLLPITNRPGISQLSDLILAKWGFAMAASGLDLQALSPSLDEDPLWDHQLSTWLFSATALITLAVLFSALTRFRLEAKYLR
jgi:energy-coupling factor transporter ATP-binding protein EcfA2